MVEGDRCEGRWAAGVEAGAGGRGRALCPENGPTDGRTMRSYWIIPTSLARVRAPARISIKNFKLQARRGTRARRVASRRADDGDDDETRRMPSVVKSAGWLSRVGRTVEPFDPVVVPCDFAVGPGDFIDDAICSERATRLGTRNSAIRWTIVLTMEIRAQARPSLIGAP